MSSAETTHPQYSHIEHTLRPSLSSETYGKLISKGRVLNTHQVQTTQSHNLPLSSIHPVSSALSLATERGGGDYEKLHHATSSTAFVRSNTEPLFLQQPHPNEAHTDARDPQTTCQYATIQHHVQEEEQEEDEDDSPFSPIYTNITLMKLGGEKEEVGGDSSEPHPPPVPPRLKKTNSS